MAAFELQEAKVYLKDISNQFEVTEVNLRRS
jgi:hypothetical protein